MQEIELKVKYDVKEKEKVIQYCESNHFTRKGTVIEKDVYFSPRDRDFMKEDCAIRLRFVTREEKCLTQCKLTYKGPNRAEHMHSREELEVAVEDGDILNQILERLDFQPIASVVKKRIYYIKDNLTVCLDQVSNLGEYMELELLSDVEQANSQEIINRLLNDMMLKTVEYEPCTYLELILRAMKKGRKSIRVYARIRLY